MFPELDSRGIEFLSCAQALINNQEALAICFGVVKIEDAVQLQGLQAVQGDYAVTWCGM